MAGRSTPYDVIAENTAPRRVVKAEVLSVCAALEDAALADPPVVAVAAVQDMRFASPRARQVWKQLAEAGTDVRVYGRDLPAYVTDGVPGVTIDDEDPLVDVWAFLCQWRDGRARAMAGSDVGAQADEAGVNDLDRSFDLVETDDPALVTAALGTLDPRV